MRYWVSDICPYRHPYESLPVRSRFQSQGPENLTQRRRVSFGQSLLFSSGPLAARRQSGILRLRFNSIAIGVFYINFIDSISSVTTEWVVWVKFRIHATTTCIDVSFQPECPFPALLSLCMLSQSGRFVRICNILRTVSVISENVL